MTAEEIVERYNSKFRLLGKESPLTFEIKDNEIWIQGLDLQKVEDAQQYKFTKQAILKIPKFVSGVSISLSTLYSRSRNYLIDELVIDGQDVKLKGKLSNLLYDARVHRLIIKRFDATEIQRFDNFLSNQAVEYVDLSGLKTRKIKQIDQAFGGCQELKTIDIQMLNFDGCVQMHALFYKCTNIETIRLPKISGNQLYDLQQAFCECSNLVSVNTEDINITLAGPVYLSKMFFGCWSLEAIDIRNIQFIECKCHIEDMLTAADQLEELVLQKQILTDKNRYALKKLEEDYNKQVPSIIRQFGQIVYYI